MSDDYYDTYDAPGIVTQNKRGPFGILGGATPQGFFRGVGNALNAVVEAPRRLMSEYNPGSGDQWGYDPGRDTFQAGMTAMTGGIPFAQRGAVGAFGGKLFTDMHAALGKQHAPTNSGIADWMHSELAQGVTPAQFTKDWTGTVMPQAIDWMLNNYYKYPPASSAGGSLHNALYGPNVPSVGQWPMFQMELPLQGGQMGRPGWFIDTNLPTDWFSRLARGRDQGFVINPHDPTADRWLHGTHMPEFTQFDPKTFGYGSGSVNEPAFWFTKFPQVSQEYSGTVPQGAYHGLPTTDPLNMTQPRTIPVYVRPHSQRVVDYASNPELDIGNKHIYYDSGKFRDILQDAKKTGHRSVLFKDVRDMGPTSDQLAMFYPHDIRSVNALFDPKKKYDPNLLSGIAGVTLGAPLGAYLLDRNQQ